jgi:hypothetical protein
MTVACTRRSPRPAPSSPHPSTRTCRATPASSSSGAVQQQRQVCERHLHVYRPQDGFRRLDLQDPPDRPLQRHAERSGVLLHSLPRLTKAPEAPPSTRRIGGASWRKPTLHRGLSRRSGVHGPVQATGEREGEGERMWPISLVCAWGTRTPPSDSRVCRPVASVPVTIVDFGVRLLLVH